MSALSITLTFMVAIRVRLSPFAMRTVFPSSDYYGVSVPMWLAPVRESRFPNSIDVIRMV